VVTAGRSPPAYIVAESGVSCLSFWLTASRRVVHKQRVANLRVAMGTVQNAMGNALVIICIENVQSVLRGLNK
jgi:hypothetical protein